MKNSLVEVGVDQLIQHPYHQSVYQVTTDDYLEESLKRTGNEPVYPIIVVPVINPTIPDLYWVVSGMNRLNTLKQMGLREVVVIVRKVKDETELKNLIIDLNKHRIKTGCEVKMEFRHYGEMYPDQRGIPGSRYSKIGKEMGRSKDRIKDFVMLDSFFKGEGDVILEKIFGNELSVSQGFLIKKVVEKYPEKFTSEGSFEKLCDRSFDFKRLDYSLSNLDLNDETEFDLMKRYLQKDLTTDDFRDLLVKMGKVEEKKESHKKNKVTIPEIDPNYISNHVHLIQGNNRTVDFVNPFGKLINCIVGSPPYGDLRLNGTDPSIETGHNMTGREYGVYLSETYERYKQFMSPEGSIYVIIDDFRNKLGSLSCSIEHFVVEMERKGFFLVGRYVWWKNNPQPRSHKSRNMVNGFEMVYRFVLDPENYYTNPNLFIELDEKEQGIYSGCTNTDNRGHTTHGGLYYQPNLKKPRNTFDEDVCKQIVLDNIQGLDDDFRKNIDVIRGNAQRPEDYFRKDGENRHTSTSPQYLTMTLILESTQPGDLVVDIWNGVGGTMESSLQLRREYIGVELEENYFRQTQRRCQMIESELGELKIGTNKPDLGIAA
jgi:DNA modification methylase